MNRGIKESLNDRIFTAVNTLILIVLGLLVLYPIYFIIIASISDPTYVNMGKTMFWPKGLNFLGYKKLLEYPEILTGYKNTVIYTVVGTLVNMFVVVFTAFSLSRRELPGRKLFNIYFVITMYVSGGVIPRYIVVNGLHLTNTMWSLIIPGALNVYNMIVCRSFFENSIPQELYEATKIDGGGWFTFFFKIVLPLSKPILAVMVLYHALVHWNRYLEALYYIRDSSKYPLQMILKSLTAELTVDSIQGGGADAAVIAEKLKMRQSVRYSLIMVASVPVFLIYPFVQKYFVKGVMIGSVKG